jgi:hypothetical protein
MSKRLPIIAVSLGLVSASLAFSSRSFSQPDKKSTQPVQPTPTPGQPAAPNRHSGGLLLFDVRDADTDQPIPCKLTFVGVDGTPRPSFTHNDIGRPEGEFAISAFDRTFSAVGNEDIRVPFGTYDIYVSRGPEWDVSVHKKVKIGPEPTTKLVARLRHVIDTRGWLSADFHVHAAPSPDSIVPLTHRVIEFVADGIDMIVSTDHNLVTDYAPSIKALGLGALITSARGDELTTNGWGHFGAFPLPQDLARAGQGAILVHGHNAKEIFANAREHAPETLIDVHHPRLDSEVGYFIVGQFDPHSDHAGRSGFSFDFDAIEVLNGYQDPARKSVDKVIDDWLGLLNHGHLVTATGNSDTHHLAYNLGGYPRNYVRVADDRPDHVTPKEVATAVKDHHAFFTTGPFVRVHAGKADMGDLAPAPGGKATLDIEVDAAPWISVNRVILYVSGKEAKRWPIAESQDVVRFKASYDINLPTCDGDAGRGPAGPERTNERKPTQGCHVSDGYAVVRVDGDKIMAPVVGDNRTFGVYPLALTNPIFFDVNGNGRYDQEHQHGQH